MTRRRGVPFPVPGWGAVVENINAEVLPPGTLESSENTVSMPGGAKRGVRGGSRIMNSFQNDNGTPADVDDMLFVGPYTQTGAATVGWDAGEVEHYIWLLNAELGFPVSEASSRAALTSWDTGPGRPLFVELFENLYLVDATKLQANRNPLLRIESDKTVTKPQFDFGGGVAVDLTPYTAEAFNSVLFIAGHDGAVAGAYDEPAILRHSYLARDPASSSPAGFDNDAWALVGSKGERITALKAGGNIMLVTKANEIYRVYGNPLADAGWQFAIEPLDNEFGFGVSNAYALAYSNGYWYGIGEGGPFRTDGRSVEPLSPILINSWRAFDGDIDRSWVSVHQERRSVLFGIPANGVYPQAVWVWNTDLERWDGKWTFPFQIHHCGSVAKADLTTGSVGPTGAPTSLSIGTETLVGFTVSFTVTDGTAKTEVWLKDVTASGDWYLHTVLAENVATTGAITGLNGYNEYKVRIRHTKAAIPSDWDVEAGTSGYTLIPAPTAISASATGAGGQVTVTHNANGADLRIERYQVSSGWVTATTYTDKESGVVVFNDSGATCSETAKYRAVALDAAWPPATSSAYTSETGDICPCTFYIGACP